MSEGATSSGLPRAAAYLAAGSAYLLIVAGGLVRATGSGLGCPDWPLCHGQPLPPAAQAPIIEFSHRMLASITTMVAVAASFLTLRTQSSGILRLLAIAVPLLLLIIIGLGAVVVVLELPQNVVTAHLALAFLLLGMLASEAVLLTPRHESVPAAGAELVRLTILASAVVYGQALLGGLVRGSGAGLACTGFPLCNGELIPSGLGGLVGLHLLHRAGAAIVVGLLIYLAVRAHKISPGTSIAALSKIALTLALLQGAIGIFAVTTLLPPVSQVLHVAGAAAVWASTVILAVRAASDRGPSAFAERTDRHRSPWLASAG